MQRFETTCHGTHLQHCPRPHWPGNALEAPHPKVVELEETAQKPSRAFGDDERAWRGQRLQAGGEVRSFALTSPSGARTTPLANWDEA